MPKTAFSRARSAQRFKRGVSRQYVFVLVKRAKKFLQELMLFSKTEILIESESTE